MDLYSATTGSNKLRKYVEGVFNSAQTFYKASKHRLLQIRDNCELIVSMINSRLGEEANEASMYDLTDVANSIKRVDIFLRNFAISVEDIDGDTIEFMRSIGQDCKSVMRLISQLSGDKSIEADDTIAAMNENILKLLELVGHSTDSATSEPEKSDSVKKPKAADKSCDTEETPKHTSTTKPNDRKQAIINYSDTLSSIVKKPCESNDAKICLDILNRWFQARFLRVDKQFRYNMKDVPKWLVGIVETYGIYQARNEESEFISTMNDWISSCSKDGCKYAVPYPVYRCMVNPPAENITIDVLHIWDNILEVGLESLCYMSPSTLYPGKDDVYDWVSKHNPDILSGYNQVEV